MLHIFPIYGGRAAPFFEDKNYSVFWKIVDNKLYLNEIYLYKLLSPIDEDKILFPDNEQYKAIEHLTGKEFNKDDSAVIEKTVAPYGVIQATWVNGDFIIKPVIPDSVGWTSEWEKTEPAFRITFKNGEIIEVSQR